MVQVMIYIILPQAYRNVIPTLLSQVITTIKDSSYLANVATIELMARTKQLLSAASRYNGTGNVNVSDVFVLFGMAALIYFIINYILSCVVRSMQKRRKRPVRVMADPLPRSFPQYWGSSLWTEISSRLRRSGWDYPA